MKLLNGRLTILLHSSSLAPILHPFYHLRNEPELLGILREEILNVLSRHVTLDPDKVQIRMDRGKIVSTLAVDIEIPNRTGTALAGAA